MNEVINNSDNPLKFDLTEVDWVILTDYLDDIHAISLSWLCSTSSGTTWCLGYRIIDISWFMLLQELEPDIQSTIVEILRVGK